jgi:hypothetical protein
MAWREETTWKPRCSYRGNIKIKLILKGARIIIRGWTGLILFRLGTNGCGQQWTIRFHKRPKWLLAFQGLCCMKKIIGHSKTITEVIHLCILQTLDEQSVTARRLKPSSSFPTLGLLKPVLDIMKQSFHHFRGLPKLVFPLVDIRRPYLESCHSLSGKKFLSNCFCIL